jgi:hypothetical protein
VEKRKRGGPWEKVNDYPIMGESTTVPDLDEGAEYEFRVAAVTAPGVGEFSLATAPIVVKEKKCMLSLVYFLVFYENICYP